MTIGKGFVTQTAFKKHLDGDWRTVHELWSHIRNYMASYAAPDDSTYSKTEIDAFFEGYSGGKAQVDAGNVVGLTQGSIPFADASGFLTEANSALFYDAGNVRLGVGTGSPQNAVHLYDAAADISMRISGKEKAWIQFECLDETDGFSIGIEQDDGAVKLFRMNYDDPIGTGQFTFIEFDAINSRIALVGTGPTYPLDIGGNTRIDATLLTTGAVTFDSTLGVAGLLSNTGGAKLEIQGTVNGGSTRGIFLWDTSSTNWGIYMSESGAGKSLADGAACTDLSGSTGHHFRFRISDTADRSFVWENSSETCLMDLEGDTGNLSILGNILTTGTINGVILSKETTDNYVLTDVLPGAYNGAVGNIAIGKDAGQAVTSGDYNVCIGYQSGMAITTASHNICMGQEAGKRLVDGIRNFFFGYRAGSYCVSGGQNVSIGYDANVTGTASNNFALGYYALRALTGGSGNVAIGSQALQNAGNTSQNTAIGMAAGLLQSTGNDNIYIGYHAGEQDDGSRNLYIGTNSGILSGTSSYNVGLGYKALLGVLAGVSNYNVSIGYESGYGINAGDNNVFLGAKAGYHVTTGTGNVCIGYMAGETNLTTGNNQLWIANSNTATPLIYGEFDNAYLLINGRLAVAFSTIGDDERGLSSIHTLSDNPAKSDGIGFYSEGHIGAITTDGPTYGAGIWLNIDAGATLGADVRALDIGIYEAGATCAGVNAYGLAIHMEFDDTDPPAAIYAFRINCNDTPGHATPDALIFAPNRSAIALTDAAPGTADAYLKVVLQDGSVYRIPLVKE